MPDLSVNIGPLQLKNPVLTASGTFGYAEEFADFFDLSRLGGIITKTVTLQPRPGNAPPRICETDAGMLNSIGLPNVGVEKFLSEKMPFLRTLKTAIIINVAGKDVAEFVQIVQRLEEVDGIDALELNYSCPNVKEGGLSFSSDAKVAERVTAAVRKVSKRVLITKLTPNVTSIGDIGYACQNGGADAISAINTVVGMKIDIHRRRPLLATNTGGLSGPAIRPIALAKVWELVRRVSIPVIGIGGICNVEDALEFLIAGAVAVQIGTAHFIHPKAAVEVIEGLERFCHLHNVEKITQVIGSLQPNA